jgi:hypothetical protein
LSLSSSTRTIGRLRGKCRAVSGVLQTPPLTSRLPPPSFDLALVLTSCTSTTSTRRRLMLEGCWRPSIKQRRVQVGSTSKRSIQCVSLLVLFCFPFRTSKHLFPPNADLSSPLQSASQPLSSDTSTICALRLFVDFPRGISSVPTLLSSCSSLPYLPLPRLVNQHGRRSKSKRRLHLISRQTNSPSPIYPHRFPFFPLKPLFAQPQTRTRSHDASTSQTGGEHHSYTPRETFPARSASFDRRFPFRRCCLAECRDSFDPLRPSSSHTAPRSSYNSRSGA